ncbi:CpCOWP1 [Cryptosporidium parvum]|uniref:Oocyst EB module wall protein n=86 Tax=Cryptosporidium TaxID=5806 RepID=A0A7G2HKJ3_CRYPV|nr:Growth factor receptor cysteine-rich domain containing protein [Cryptosporidium parvum]WKS78318.1 CpCOWP1 [Cryptosporidium sp. 43IA8]WRK32808.1 Growth factor receptor cysteine-rich domain containing protein [Cryptosporidium parvum]CAD98498.1 oocyst EB module wall protein [Cryptosporidium parvum]|eukprot:QOY41089.1 hypothetical protein CPATCC_002734 [Cryptosporidium parvum]
MKRILLLSFIIGAFGAPQVKPNIPGVASPLPHTKGQVPTYVETPLESCPPGYLMENGVCVQRIQVPPMPFCQEPAIYHEGHCLIVTAPLKQCPPGYEISGKQCTATKTASQQPSCPPGTTLHGTECISKHMIDTVCPPGFVDNGRDCVAFTMPEKSCPPGFVFSGKQCVQSDTAPPNPECPPGTILENGTCKLIQQIDTVCPSGFVEEGNRCVQYLPANKICPPGFNLSGQQCMAPESAELESTCPPNSIFENGKCKVIKNIDMVCPPGYTDSGDDCVLYVAPAKECPPNFILQGLQCIQTSSAPTQPVCPPGTVLQDNACISVQAIDAICPPEFLDNGKDCVKYSPVTKECPPGFTLSGNRCVQMVNAPMEFECPPGTILKDDQCQSIERVDTICPPGFVDNGEDCVQFSAPEKICPQGFSLSGKQCVKTESAPRLTECPPGTTLENNSCISYELEDAICPPGYLDNGSDCVQFSQPEKECPTGFVLIGKQCTQTTQAPPQPECPPGTNLVNGQCQKVERINMVCPTGFIDNGTNCASFSAPNRECPPGYTLSGSQCEQIKEAPPVSECPPGYKLQGNQCTALKMIDAICPDGFLPNGDDCIQFSPASTVCPTGFTLQNQQCVQTTTSPKTPECPPGSALDGDSCTRLVPGALQYVCPVGTREGDVCVERSISSPVLECPPGYSLETGKQCVRRSQYDCSVTTYVTECKTPDVKALRRLAAAKETSTVYETSEIQNPGHHHGHSHGHSHSQVIPIQTQNIHTQHHKEAPRPICEDVPKITPKTCTKADSVPAVPICENNAELVGKECVLTNYYPLEAICQDGTRSKECAKFVKTPPTLKCPPGSVDVGSQCQVNKYSPYDLACPAGYALVGDKCATTREKVCPNESCQRVVTAPVSLTCPPGYHQIDEVMNISAHPHHRHLAGVQSTSQKGYSHGHKYTPVISQPPQPVPVVAPIQQMKCIHADHAPYNLICPVGSRLVADKCVTYSDKICPNGNCERIYNEPAELVCPPGFSSSKPIQPISHSHINHPNVSVPVQPQTINQPQVIQQRQVNYQPQVIHQTQEILTTYPTPVYQTGTIYQGHHHHHHHHHRNLASPECIKTISVPYILKCESPFILDGDKCIEKTEKICLQGDCRKQVVVPPTLSCPQGYRNANGIQTAISSKHTAGTHHYSTPSAECVRTIFEEYSLVCSSGFVLLGDRCALFTNKICPNGNCERLISKPANMVCPPGFTRPQSNHHSDHAGHGHGHGNQLLQECTKQIYTPYDLSCPDNYSIIGDKCAIHTVKVCPDGNCEQLIRSPPTMECPPGYYRPQAGVAIRSHGHKASGASQCMRNVYEPYALQCPDGFRLLGDMCQQSTAKVCPNNNCERISYIPPILSCPQNFERSGQRCIANEYADYELACPPGLIVISDKCAKYADKVCPNGDCERIRTFPPELVCPPGYTMEAGVAQGTRRSLGTASNHPHHSSGHHHALGHHHHHHAVTQEVSIVRTTVCSREVFAPYSLSCTADSQLLGDRCARFAPKVCPSGGCEKIESTPVVSSCPSGYVTDQDGTCYIVEYAPFSLTCNDPYTLFDNKECVLVTKPDSRCPDNTEKTSTGCVKKVITTPIVSYETTCIGPTCNAA